MLQKRIPTECISLPTGCCHPEVHSPLITGSWQHPSAVRFWSGWSDRRQLLMVCIFFLLKQWNYTFYWSAAPAHVHRLRTILTDAPWLSRPFTLPGVFLGVLDADELLAFLCHRALAALVIGMSNFITPWISFSNPNWSMAAVPSKWSVCGDTVNHGPKTYGWFSSEQVL